jgi:hypothetical protein
MKGKLIAFNDTELGDWLIDLIEDGAEDFLCALAEAVVTADAEDYRVIRPGLIELKRKHCNGDHTQVPDRRLSPGKAMPPEILSARSQMQ